MRAPIIGRAAGRLRAVVAAVTALALAGCAGSSTALVAPPGDPFGAAP
jgi:hypothetical protein